MIGTPTIRSAKRWFCVALVWAMVPAIVWAGVPTVSCACVKCQCGAGCSVAPHSATTLGASSGQADCCANCPCAGTAHCCCKSKLAAAKQATCRHLPGNGFGGSDKGGCRTSVTSLTGIRATAVVADDDQPLTIDHPAATDRSHSSRSLDRANALITGPPVDLVVTLQRLVI
jgi:hypothetical protein